MKAAKPAAPRKPARRRAGKLPAHGFGFAVVVSRFNQYLTQQLLAGALDGLERLGAEARRIEVVEVPGAFEIPAAARKLAETGRFDAVICLGLILRGETPHFDAISREVARGVGQSALETGVPHAFGVLTCDTMEQAVQRAGLKFGNKGWDAAMAAAEMANLFAALRKAFPIAKP
jgi:6,7-dimethyl-8-ribityllumazine synthase